MTHTQTHSFGQLTLYEGTTLETKACTAAQHENEYYRKCI